MYHYQLVDMAIIAVLVFVGAAATAIFTSMALSGILDLRKMRR